ncbi:hypothetical protein TL16_g10019 [Triparma laevis f. inornata]|uniref:Aspartyl/asparaginy/proline hydroxylase domain-containing protein n=2 Tax=Triparma laevis TaxID=1534972 RepID=A0A9W7A4B0_9STRA|nr:hypothetical protein TrLO_g9934 [Triparma laevis f. longispina]GMH84759.1 hypothetical protein TL16_g10019 [Triparma laevis f. inornata]
MLHTVSEDSLRDFIGCEAMSPLVYQRGSVQLSVPIWDAMLLVEDCQHLMREFQAGTQFGDTHGKAWTTLSLRSCDGTTANDAPSPSKQYMNSSAWDASTYIVPSLLKSFGEDLVSCFERVRLSVIPPSCNVAWHCDYTHAEKHVTRLHIPILTSDGFELDIGGTIVKMNVGESHIGNFELPHRLGNTKTGQLRVHLMVDILMPKAAPVPPSPPPVIVIEAPQSLSLSHRCSAKIYFLMWSCLCGGGGSWRMMEKDEDRGGDDKVEVEGGASAVLISAFHHALNVANDLLDGDAVALARRTACIDAFSEVRPSEERSHELGI